MTVPKPTGLDALQRGIASIRAHRDMLLDQCSDLQAELTRTKMVLQRVIRGTPPMSCSDKEAWDMAEGIIAREP